MRIGAHASIAGGVRNAVTHQVEYGGNCGQIFSHSPQVWRQPAVEEDDARAFREGSIEHDIDPWLLHSSYLVNLATPDADLRERSIASLQAELDAAERLGIEFVNVHLGAHTGAGVETGLTNAASALDALSVPDGVTVLIETDAGAGTKLGGSFDHLRSVLTRCGHTVEVCLDTAHVWAAGYDLSDEAAVAETLAEFDDVVGLKHLSCVHLNDSKHAQGTNRDEHAHLGEGEIGADGIRAILTHPALRDTPYVLETPKENGKGFPWNVARARELSEAAEGPLGDRST